MRIGIQTSCTDQSLTPQALAAEAEGRGFSTLLFAEHPHIPLTRESARPQHHGGGELPDYYKRTWDPFVACSFAAAATTTLEIGTGICQLALRDPIITAKSAASIDRLSEGRFVFGVGFGWNADEFPSHGQDFTHRHRVVRERIGAITSLWTEDVASYTGTFVNVAPSWCWPKPVASPHPPILVGGDGPLAMKHAAEWASYWYPTNGALARGTASTIRRLKDQAETLGRDPEDVDVWPLALPGTERRLLEEYLEAGVQRVNLAFPSLPGDAQLRELDRLSTLVGDLAG
jgi:probable F420-dependent oxidoreductase